MSDVSIHRIDRVESIEHEGRIGRPPITEETWFSESKLLAAYKVYGSATRAAKALGINKMTALKYLKKNGIDTSTPLVTFKPDKVTHRAYGCLAVWIFNHPGVELPASPTKISEITGCSQDAIKCYLYRQRSRVADTFEKLSSLFHVQGTFKDTEGEYRAFSAIETYKMTHNKYRYSALVEAKLRTGEDVTFVIDDIRALIVNQA